MRDNPCAFSSTFLPSSSSVCGNYAQVTNSQGHRDTGRYGQTAKLAGNFIQIKHPPLPGTAQHPADLIEAS